MSDNNNDFPWITTDSDADDSFAEYVAKRNKKYADTAPALPRIGTRGDGEQYLRALGEVGNKLMNKSVIGVTANYLMKNNAVASVVTAPIRSKFASYHEELGKYVWNFPRELKITKKNTASVGRGIHSSSRYTTVGAVEKEINKNSLKTLTGNVRVVPNDNTLGIHVRDTIKMEGFGKYLSGNYYVRGVTRTLSSAGYSETLDVVIPNFGGHAYVPDAPATDKATETKAEPQVEGKTYTVKRGDSLWKIAVKFYGKGSMYTKIYDANTGQIANPNLIYTGQVLNIT